MIKDKRLKKSFLFAGIHLVVFVVVLIMYPIRRINPETGYDEPEGFYDYYKEITQTINGKKSGYKPNYTLRELNKAVKNRPAHLKSTVEYNWIQRGPGNVAGRIRTILIDPDDESGKTWYVGSASGGIWKTLDGGSSWENLTPDLPNLSTASLAVATSNTNILYAGTGEGFGGEGMVSGNGIYKSIDKGESWEIIPSTYSDTHFEYVNKIWVSPTDYKTVIAVTNKGVFRSSTGGETWDTVFSQGYVVQDIVQNPENESILYAGVNSLGVIKSTDQGQTWFRSLDGMGECKRVSLSVSPVDTSYIYAGVEGTNQETQVYQSQDAGKSWELNYDADGLFLEFHQEQGWFNNAIAAHPFDRSKVYVGGVYMGLLEFGSASYTGSQDVIRVDTFNLAKYIDFVDFSGSKFEGALATGLDEGADVENKDFVSVEIRFGKGVSQKAHRFIVPEGEGSGVPPKYYTYTDYVDVPFEVWDIDNNRQLMVSFRDQDRNGEFNLIERDWNEDVDGREYLFVNAVDYNSDSPSEDIAKTGGYEYKLLYFLWPTLPEDGVWNPDNMDDALLRVDWGSIQYREAYTTILADDRLNENLHVDHHDIKFFITDSSSQSFDIIEANDGGLGYSTDGGSTWEQLKKGYHTTQFYGIAKRPGLHQYIGGMQDNGTWQSPLGQSAGEASEYELKVEGDGFECLWHPWYPQRILASSYYNYIKVSNDYGETWQWVDGDILGDGPFITKLANSRDNPNLVFAVGSRGIYRHPNFGLGTASWELIDLGDDWAVSNTVLSSHNVEVSKADPSVVWAGGGMYHNPDLHLFVSKDYGESFDSAANYTDVELGYISGLATHPTNSAEAFVLFSLSGKPKILRTYDYGKNWEDITGFAGHDGDSSNNGFPDVIVNDLLVLPYDTNTIWVGTEIGLFESTDNGATWNYSDVGLPAVSIWQLDFVDDNVLVATHGRGIWTAGVGVSSVKETTQDSFNVNVYPNPASDKITISSDDISNESCTLAIISISGKQMLKKTINTSVDNEIDISGFASGTYMVILNVKGIDIIKKLVVY